MKKTGLITTFFFNTLIILAQNTIVPPSGTEVAAAAQNELSGWASFAFYLMVFINFVGAIYVVATLISKREMGKGIMISWLISIAITAIAWNIYGDKLL